MWWIQNYKFLTVLLQKFRVSHRDIHPCDFCSRAGFTPSMLSYPGASVFISHVCITYVCTNNLSSVFYTALHLSDPPVFPLLHYLLFAANGVPFWKPFLFLPLTISNTLRFYPTFVNIFPFVTLSFQKIPFIFLHRDK